MEKLVVKGGHRLSGTVRVSGAKNAVLPIIAASVLGTEGSVISEVPELEDVSTICKVLDCLGLKVDASKPHTLKIDSRVVTGNEAPYDLVSTMRATFLVMGSLLARVGKAKISLPGGCAIGTRPIDIHLKGFEALGARIEQGHGSIEASAPKGLVGTTIYLDFPSVGATENLMMAASMAKGTTIIENAAQEPEIVDLANYINVMGGKVRGAGTTAIHIDGVESMKGGEHIVIPDRIEAGIRPLPFCVAIKMAGRFFSLTKVTSTIGSLLWALVSARLLFSCISSVQGSALPPYCLQKWMGFMPWSFWAYSLRSSSLVPRKLAS